VPNHLSGQGHFFLSINDRSKASAVFKKVLQGDPNNLLGILGAGWVALEMGWWADAEKYWEKALKLYPNNPGPPYFWHNYYLVRKNYSGALQSLQTAQQLGFPQNVLLFSALGKVYEKLNQPAKAAEFYEKILKLEPDNAEARLKVGTAAVLTQ
jgi:tetratricopeptide (TPR) repeat protein